MKLPNYHIKRVKPEDIKITVGGHGQHQELDVFENMNLYGQQHQQPGQHPDMQYLAGLTEEEVEQYKMLRGGGSCQKYYDFPHHLKRRVFNNGGLAHMMVMDFFHNMEEDLQLGEYIKFPKFEGRYIK